MLNRMQWSFMLCLMLAAPVMAQVTFAPAFPNIGFSFPTEIQNAGDSSNRLFVVEQAGTIKVFPNTRNVRTAQVSTFLDISDRVAFSPGQEIGLLGLAFHPDFENNNLFYVYYTASNNGIIRIVVEQFAANGNSANRNTGQVIMQFDKNQRNSNHNGGKIAFGPDGYLYASVGDGGGGGDPQRNAQNLNNAFGKLLRVDVDLDGSNPTSANGRYEIPGDNPFVGRAGLDIIYAYGIRNTWKFAFDNPTGRLWGADVGQNGSRAREEINLMENGGNYGWSRFQDDVIWNNDVPNQNNMTSAISSYNHSRGDRSITGGYVYRGSNITSTNPDITNQYIYGDFVSGRVWALDYNETTGRASSTLLFRTNGQSVSSFGEDEGGNLYFSDYAAGQEAQLYALVDGDVSDDGVAVNGIGEWSELGQGTDGIVRSTAQASNGTIYHGGTFSRAGNLSVRNIAAWREGAGWSALGTGANGTVNAIAVAENGTVYIGGAFTSVGGVDANNVAMWDGASWSALQQGVDGTVAALAISPSNGNVMVGGTFQSVGSNVDARNIAQWNGTAWSNLQDSDSGANGMNNEARSLHIDNSGLLYVGGNFDEAGGRTANRIATWNGNRWGTLGQGTSGFVQSITSNANFVYVGGNFAIAGGRTVNRVARWDRSAEQWQPLGNGLSGAVNSLVVDQLDNVYVGGSFATASPSANSNLIMNNVARWSESEAWQALGMSTDVGVDIQVTSILNTGGTETQINVAGSFSRAGTIAASNTGNWTFEGTPPPPPPPTDVVPPLTLPNASWQQFSLPCDPGNNNTVAALFGDDNLGEYGSDWIIWAFDGATNSYQNVDEQTAIELGRGYWIIQQSGETRQLEVPASCTTTAKSASAQCPAANGCFAAPIIGPAVGSAQTAQYQMVGYPFAYEGSVVDTYVSTEGGNCRTGCAVGSTEANDILEPMFWNYNGSSYDVRTVSDQHSPWLGYWVQGLQGAADGNAQILFGQSRP